jgi:hypothetical protein
VERGRRKERDQKRRKEKDSDGMERGKEMREGDEGRDKKRVERGKGIKKGK